jgi:hypothetical protein
VLDVPFPVDQDSDLPSNLVGKLRQLPCKLGGDDLVCRDAPLVHLLQSANLIGLEPQCFSLDLRDEMAPFDGSVDDDSQKADVEGNFSPSATNPRERIPENESSRTNPGNESRRTNPP